MVVTSCLTPSFVSWCMVLRVCAGCSNTAVPKKDVSGDVLQRKLLRIRDEYRRKCLVADRGLGVWPFGSFRKTEPELFQKFSHLTDTVSFLLD